MIPADVTELRSITNENIALTRDLARSNRRLTSREMAGASNLLFCAIRSIPTEDMNVYQFQFDN